MSLNLPDEINQEEFANQVLSAAKDNDVSVFTTTGGSGGVNESILTIYCTDGAEKVIEKKSYIHAGNYESSVFESTRVEVKPITELPVSGGSLSLYGIGDEEHFRAFRHELSTLYEPGPSSEPVADNDLYVIYGTWVVAFLVLLMFTVFEILAFEKEKTVLVIVGGNVLTLMLRRILADAAALTAMFFAARFVTSFVCNSGYLGLEIFLAFLIFLVCNSCLYLFMLRIDVRKSMSGAFSYNKVVGFLSVTKCVICACLLMGFTFAAQSLFNTVSFFKQDRFFRDIEDLNYVYFLPQEEAAVDDLASVEMNRYEIREKFHEAYGDDELILNLVSEVDGKKLINMNSAALDLFKDKVKFTDPDVSCEQLIKDKKQALLVPDGIAEDVIKKAVSRSFFDTDEDDSGQSVDVIRFRRLETVCLGTGENGSSTYEINPIVALNGGISSEASTVYRVSEEDCEEILKPYMDYPEKWTFRCESAKETYEINRAKARETTILLSVIVLIMVTLAIFTIVSITKLYFTAHKMELAVKYFLGYSMFQFLSSLLRINLIVLAIASALCILFCAVSKAGSLLYLFIGILLLGGLDMISLLLMYRNFIRRNIVEILKGRALS